MTVSLATTAPATEIHLTRGEIAELSAARTSVRRAWTPLLDVRRDTFALPTLGRTLDRLACELDRADHVVVRGLAAGCPERDLPLLLWGVGRHLGVAVPQDVTGRLVVRGVAADAAARSGGSDVTALLAVGGPRRVTLVDSRALYAEVVRHSGELADQLFVPVAYAATGEPGYRMLPLACRTAGRLSVRYDRDAIELAQLDPGAPTLTRKQRELLDLVDGLIRGLQYDVLLEAGDLLLVNNHEALHRVGHADASGVLRLWLTLREGRPLPASYLWPTPAYGDTGGRGGVTPRDTIQAPSRRTSRQRT